jgi:hypothetical protein
VEKHPGFSTAFSQVYMELGEIEVSFPQFPQRRILVRDFQLKKYRIPRGAEGVTVVLSP